MKIDTISTSYKTIYDISFFLNAFIYFLLCNTLYNVRIPSFFPFIFFEFQTE